MTGLVSLKDVKPGSYIMIDSEPCKIMTITKSKPGRHGSAKARVETIGLFDSKKRVIIKPASATVMVPMIDKKKAQVISITGDIAQLMDMENYSTFEARIPEKFKSKIQPGGEISYWKVGDRILLRE